MMVNYLSCTLHFLGTFFNFSFFLQWFRSINVFFLGNTYQKIAETRNEWQRQWARIVLVVERGVSPMERLKNFNFYSQPMSDGRRALVLRLNMTVCVVVQKRTNYIQSRVYHCRKMIRKR